MACNTFIVSSTLRYRSSSVVASAKHHHNDHSILDVGSLKRDSFPHDFTFGAASAAYQYEGAAHKYGRGTSIWDTFTHKHPEKIADRSNGDRALDQYNRYKQDVTFMKDMNLDAYRFSISWSRILPNGKISGGINQEGIDYYNRLIDELIQKGLKPFVTIFHWDLPQALEDEYGGFLSRSIIDDYTKYAELCFKEFGGKVKHWITFNEPFIFSGSGYASGIMAPGRSSTYLNPAAAGEEPYLVSHHLLLAHAKAVKSYRESQNGEIGITLNSRWFEPFSHKQADQEAAKRALEFELGWYMKPLTSGHYPKIMRYIVGKRLPEFSEEEAHLIKGSFDFIGLNYYTSIYAANDDKLYYDVPDLYKDPRVNLTPTRDDGTPIGPVATGSRWLSVYPKGIRELLVHLKDEYKDPIIYITENGVNELNDPTLSLQESLMDIYRIDFYYRHLYYVHSAIFKHDVRVKGYFAWSLLDCFEWSSGYTSRFGLGFVDHNNNLERHEKLSARWFGNFLKKH